VILPRLAWPDKITVRDFLERYWQRKPLEMPGALPGFRSPLSADELAGLACEEGVESRLVIHSEDNWRLRNGPFTESQMQSLPNCDWSLLVQDVEKHLPDLAGILDPFRFLPAWRMDDLMISCAAPGGSVGPHVDAYDVFLVQAQGCRRWQWNDPGQAYSYREDSELSLVQGFSPDHEWLTRPGDVLYLPPGVAHFGVAAPGNDLCMTYSVGFRAPSRSEMLQDLAVHLEEKADLRYTDPDLDPHEASNGIISSAAIARVRNMLRQAVALEERELAKWFGALVTEPKAWLRPLPGNEVLSPAQLMQALSHGVKLRRHGMALWARWQTADNLFLFVDGRPMELATELASWVERLCGQEELNITVQALRESPAAARLITDLVNAGELEFDHEL
jgi:50S ribosomal protein L16 3-hydroxylase